MRSLTTYVFLGLCVTGCERAGSPGQGPALTITPDPVEMRVSERSVARLEPAKLVEQPRPAVAPPAPKAARTPPRPIALDPPATDDQKVYFAWLKALPPAGKAQVDAHCRKVRLNYDPVCGGIGPLHIPKPPREATFPQLLAEAAAPPPTVPPPSTVSLWDAWYESLTVAQRNYHERECKQLFEAGVESTDLCGTATPLVVAFDDQTVEYARGRTFAFSPGHPVAADMPTATTPWIALDRDGNGTIDSGAELFGDSTVLAGGARAKHGFEALADLDTNHDGSIDASDARFRELVLWADADGDGRGTAGELRPLSDTIVSISLAYRLDRRCDARGNCEGERASLTFRDATGALRTGTVVDVYLRLR